MRRCLAITHVEQMFVSNFLGCLYHSNICQAIPAGQPARQPISQPNLIRPLHNVNILYACVFLSSETHQLSCGCIMCFPGLDARASSQGSAIHSRGCQRRRQTCLSCCLRLPPVSRRFQSLDCTSVSSVISVVFDRLHGIDVSLSCAIAVSFCRHLFIYELLLCLQHWSCLTRPNAE